MVPKVLFSDTMTKHERFLRIVKYASRPLEDSLPTSVSDSIKKMFLDFGVESWADLALFSLSDIVNYYDNNKCAEITLRDKWSMGYLLKYVKMTPLQPSASLVMADIIKIVDDVGSLSSSQTPNTITVPSQQPARKTVPELDTFKGTDEDSFGWMEDTLTKLGTAGLARYLTDAGIVAKNSDLGESVFYPLRRATMNGLAKHVSEDLMHQKIYNPTNLWSNIEKYYDVNVNKANVILYEIKRLLALELNTSMTATKFISDYKDCLTRLRKVKAKIANDNEILRALLLLAIQDPNFDTVRDEILKSPTKTIEDLLTDLRERDSSLAIRDSSHNEINGDGLSYARRSVTYDNGTKNPRNNQNYSKKNEDSAKEWKVPFFSNGWRDAMGHKIFSHIISWRIEACKGRTQQQLNNKFDLKVEQMDRNRGNNRGNSPQKGNKRTFRKTSIQETEDDEKDDNDDEKPQRRSRIRLAKSGDILTEKNMRHKDISVITRKLTKVSEYITTVGNTDSILVADSGCD